MGFENIFEVRDGELIGGMGARSVDTTLHLDL